jgi:phosphatidylserine/phosphatidylglycerophosphate/cardiolipin synthase-like enzyme
MANAWVDAIQRAQTSIHIASTHLRMRPVVEALIAKKQAQPGIDIKLYLDQQEWISASGDAAQAADLQTCLAAATTDTQRQACLYNDYLFSKMVVDAGIDVRFKSYAYRWDATYAVQQHSKYMIVDGKELISGSYNLSMNSEQGTFENALHITGATFQPFVASFEHNFASIWDTGRVLLDPLRTRIANDATIPMVFDSMALSWTELDSLHTLLRMNCALADSADFRDNPAAHKTCAR